MTVPAIPDPSTTSVEALHRVCHDVRAWAAQVDNLADATEGLDRLAAVEAYLARKGKEGPAQSAARWLEVRIGELLGPAKTGRPNGNVPNAERFSRRADAVEFRDMAEYRSLVAQLEPCSRLAVLKAIRMKKRTAAEPPPVGELVTTPTFGLVYADPPWRYEHVKTANRAIENQYPTMNLDDLADVGADLDLITLDDCVLMMWATSPKLAEALWLLDRWGFRYRSSRVWVKNHIGMGYWARQRHELLLIAAHGNPEPPPEDRRPDSVIEAPRGEHSAKPLLHDDLDWQFPAVMKLELFARWTEQPSPWWRPWGNHAG